MEHQYNLSIDKSCKDIDLYLEEKFKKHLEQFKLESKEVQNSITNNLRTELLKNMTGEQTFTPNYKKDYFENFLKLLDNPNIRYDEIKKVLDKDEYIIGFSGFINDFNCSHLDYANRKMLLKPKFNNHDFRCCAGCVIVNSNSRCFCVKSVAEINKYVHKSYIDKYNRIKAKNLLQKNRNCRKSCSYMRDKEYNIDCYNCNELKKVNDRDIEFSNECKEKFKNLYYEQIFYTNKLNTITLKLEFKKNKYGYIIKPFKNTQYNSYESMYYNIYKNSVNYRLNDIQIDLISNVMNTIIETRNKEYNNLDKDKINIIRYFNNKLIKTYTNDLQAEKNNISRNYIRETLNTHQSDNRLTYYNHINCYNKEQLCSNNSTMRYNCIKYLKNQSKQDYIYASFLLHHYYHNLIKFNNDSFKCIKDYILCNWKGKILTIPEALELKSENKRLLELNIKTEQDYKKNKLILEEISKYRKLDEDLLKLESLEKEYQLRNKNLLEKEKELEEKELKIKNSIVEKEKQLDEKLAEVKQQSTDLNLEKFRFKSKNNKLKDTKARIGILLSQYRKDKKQLEEDKEKFEKYKKSFSIETSDLLTECYSSDDENLKCW